MTSLGTKISQRRDPEIRLYLSQSRYFYISMAKSRRMVLSTTRSIQERYGANKPEIIVFLRKLLADNMRSYRRHRSSAYKALTLRFEEALMEKMGMNRASAVKLAQATDIDGFVKFSKQGSSLFEFNG